MIEIFFKIKKVKHSVPWIYVIEDLNGEGVFIMWYEKDLQKTDQTKFRFEKVIKGKSDKL